MQIAGFLVRNEQPQSALQLLKSLPDDAAVNGELRYRLAIERGNANMRIPGQVDAARQHFLDALAQAQSLGADEERALREAEAHKELGFYYRNLGSWIDADAAYRMARDVLARIMGPGSPRQFREEMASIQTNWAYLKALRGAFRRPATSSTAPSRSASGSAAGNGRQFAERLGRGVLLQGQLPHGRGPPTSRPRRSSRRPRAGPGWARCTRRWQSACTRPDGSGSSSSRTSRASRTRPTWPWSSIERCSTSVAINVRAYPSALNRAGRILAAAGRVDAGLQHLDEGITEAVRVGDGWLSSANNIEYMEHAYRAWIDTGEGRYRALVDERRTHVAAGRRDLPLPRIAARWELLQGHLITTDALRSGDISDLDTAIAHYSAGFQILSDESVGSHGSAAIAREFERFQICYDQLPRQIQRSWYTRLSDDWNAEDPPEQSTSSLARLEELY